MPSGKQPGKSALNIRLQGVQHVGVTVHDMDKSMEFYTEVLGGQIVVSGDALQGDVLQNTLFQKEELEAGDRQVDPRTLGVPDCRDGSHEVLDVRFISFGNAVVELIHFRSALLSPSAPNTMERVPTCVGYGNVIHLSFHVKDDVDLNQFARDLEEECTRRDIKLVCNRVVRVRSENERREVALKYTANKFWNDPQYFIEGYSDSDFGNFHGWSLFYAKGPNGEQLEFNQVTRDIRDKFIAAQQAYNAATGTNFAWPSSCTNPPRVE